MSSSFSVSNLRSSLFWPVSIGLAVCAWVIALVSAAMVTTEAFAYWVLVFSMLTALFLLFAVGTGSLYKYRLALLAFCVYAFTYTSRYADVGIYTAGQPAQQAAGAGFLILSAILVAWILALGVEGNAALTPQRKISRQNSVIAPAQQPVAVVASSNPAAPPMMSMGQQQPVTVTTVTPGQTPRTITADSSALEVSQDAKYVYKGQALYAYTASPDDPNELSFNKGEMLDIVDNKGKWWQARKQDGTIGIVPSNYIKIV